MDTTEIRALAHHLMGAQQARAIYPDTHPRVAGAVRDLHLFLRARLGRSGSLRLARTGDGFVVEDTPVRREGDLLEGFDRLLERRGIDRLLVEPGLQRWETRTLIDALGASEESIDAAGGAEVVLHEAGVRSIRLGKLKVAEEAGRVELATSLAHVWDLYTNGVAAVRRLRQGLEDGIDPAAFSDAREVAVGMVAAVDDHADAFLLLQALHKHDAYSYTHSLNVAMLAMAMVRSMDLPRDQWLDIGLAALLHDIGKELVPHEVLNKPGRLDEEEWEIMQRHSADGARLLMGHPDVPDLAIVVAYEHQLAYEPDNPDHGRWPLHLVSQIVCVADVYDALRSNRPYRDAVPPEEAMRIMTEEADQKFDPALFAGFRSMMGAYPPGSLVELDDDCVAISLGPGAEHPDLPRVLVVRDPHGTLLEPPLSFDLSLVPNPSPRRSRTVEEVGIDPFDYF